VENFDCHFIIPDTTSLSFYGEGGETLGKHGYSKDYRPDLKQMILGLVVDGSGAPICTDMWPGNTADVTAMSEEVCAFLLLCRGFLGEGSGGITSQNYLEWKYNQSASTDSLEGGAGARRTAGVKFNAILLPSCWF